MVPELLSYFSGPYDAPTNTADFSSDMHSVLNAYSSRKPITDAIQGCTGTCIATIRAPALIADHCTTNITWQNFSLPYSHEEMAVWRKDSAPNSRRLYETSLTSKYGEKETLDFHTVFNGDKVARTCAGPVTSTHCYLRSAIAEYGVVITNETVTLKDPANPAFVSWANNTAITKETIDKFGLRQRNGSSYISTTLGGLVSAFQYEYPFGGYAAPPKHPGVLDIIMDNNGASWFMLQQITNYDRYNNGTDCVLAWDDPRPAVMTGLNEIMFRTGVHVARAYDSAFLRDRLDPGVQINYTTTGRLQSPVEVFKTDFVFFYAAAALQVLTIGLVLSTFWGYWRLGREVSFSPLEIGKVRNAYQQY
jgi:hypothetical protein